jgi:glycosyltransferase involved in cell wall biosynthesis
MRVGIVSPPWYAVPPTAYGGVELVVSLLAEALVARGVDVTVFASGDSRTTADLVSVYDSAPSERIGESIWELRHVLHAAEHSDEFDVLHDHSGPLGATVLAATGKTVVHTVHGPLDSEIANLYRSICRLHSNLALTSLSIRQRDACKGLPWAANIPNAIDTSRFVPGAGTREDYLLFLGRMCPEKGAHRAIEVAQASGRRLLLAAKCREPAEQRYFREHVEPHLGDGIEWLGEASLDEKIVLLQRAAATVVPIEWEEPFGLVMIESGACGTPVLATRRGAVPEVVVDGVTGIVVDDHREMPGVLERALELDPQEIRAETLRRFDLDHMVSAYLRTYEALAPRAAKRRRSARAALDVVAARTSERISAAAASPRRTRVASSASDAG